MGEGRDSYTLNVEFERLPIWELTDPSLNNWCHHMQYILPQGRCQFINPNSKDPNDDYDEEEEEEEDENLEEPQKETGPTLLSSISHDSYVDNLPTVPAWSISRSTDLVPAYAVAILKSNRWPGAFVYGIDKKFENIYIGFGHKYSKDNYSPTPPPPVFEEYLADLDVSSYLSGDKFMFSKPKSLVI